MGRRRVEDNIDYDLRSSGEMADEMRRLIQSNDVYGTISDQVQSLPERDRPAYLSARLTMVHTTQHGQCGSNIVENRCETAVSCLGGCRYYLRRKNDAKSRASLLRIRDATIKALERARAARALSKRTAPNWVAAQETVLRTIAAALAVDDDPTLLDGQAAAVNPGGPNLGKSLR